MRRWLVLFVVALAAALLGLSAVERDRGVEARDAEGLYAAEGEEADFAATPGTFSGSFAPPSTCGTNPVTIDPGTVTIDVTVTATLPSNDISVALIDPSGNQVAFSDTLTSPEAIHYSRSSLPAGTWTIKVCPVAPPFLAPYDYTGVVATTDAPAGDSPGVPTANGGTAGTPTPTRVDGTLRFSPETIVDPQRTEGEPVNFFAPDGSYWESGPFGTSSQQSWIHRSTDNGLSFHETSPVGLRPDAPPGGGDTDVVVDDQGYAYFSDLEGLANVGTSVSNDGGNSWRKSTLAAQEAGVDRQWFAMDDGTTSAAADNTLFFTYRQVPAGPQILSSPGSTGPNDPVGGLVWTNAASATGQLSVSSGAPCGKLVFDPVKRNLYLPCGKSDQIELVVGHVAPGQRTGVDFHAVELPKSPPGGGVNTVFPWVGVDRAGNVMAVWIDRRDRRVYETTSTDEGKTWTAPVEVSSGAAKTNTFPQVVGGDAGTFVVTWYGSDASIDSDSQPANTAADSGKYPWYGYVAVIGKADTLSPTIAQQRFTEHPMHYAMVCNSGTTCTSGRTMADYFDVGIDRKGAIRIVFDDESSQYRQAHLMEVRQLLGGPAPKSPVDDPAGDAQMPHYSPAGPGANQPQADFTKLALTQPSKGVLRVQMSLADLSHPTPPTGKSTLVWLTRFQAKSVMPNGAEAYRIFYVGAKSTAGAKPTFFAGSGDDPTGCLSTSSGCKILVYPAEQTLTSGSVSGNTITVDVSLQNGFGSGRPIDGSTLYSVTALSYGENADQDVYLEGDATPSFDYSLGSAPPASVPQPTENPFDKGVRHSGGSSAAKSTRSRSVRGSGRVGRARFTVAPKQVTFVDAKRGLRFRSLRVTSLHFGTAAARLRGVGVLNGRRVRFAAVAVDHGRRGDVFRIDIAGRAARGGVLTRGAILIT